MIIMRDALAITAQVHAGMFSCGLRCLSVANEFTEK